MVIDQWSIGRATCPGSRAVGESIVSVYASYIADGVKVVDGLKGSIAGKHFSLRRLSGHSGLALAATMTDAMVPI